MKINKVAAAALSFVLFAGTLPGTFSFQPFTAQIENAAADSAQITATDAIYPSGSLILGKSFSISGNLISENELSTVRGGIYDQLGEPVPEMVYEYPASGNSFSLASTFDKDLAFRKLTPGDYVFRIEATDIDGNTATVIYSDFTMTTEGALPSAMGVSQLSLPFDQILPGSTFAARGLISSTFAIKKVWGGVYSADGTPMDCAYSEAFPKTNSFELLSGIDPGLAFAALPEGEYTYRIQAQDILDNSFTIAEKDFKVTSDAAADITISNATYPTGNVIQGSGFGIAGVVSSVYGLEKVWGGVYNLDGTPTEQVSEAAPGTSSFNLSPFDAVLKFGQIPVGEYVYRICAEDSTGFTKVVVESPFSVRNYDPVEHDKTLGIDVSAHQTSVDWNAVKESGVEFVVLRAAYNGFASPYPVTDDTFAGYYDGAKAAGLKVGAYIFTSAFNQSEMKTNVDYLLDVVNGRELDLPLYIDVEVEDRQTSLGKKALTDLVCYGCEMIEDAGYDAGVYSSRRWFTSFIDTSRLNAKGYDIWYALWPNDPDSITMYDFCNMWQFSEAGRINGIAGDVDLNYRYSVSNKLYSITAEQPAGGTLTVDKTEAYPGEKITVTAVPSQGNKTMIVKYGDMTAVPENGCYTFIMPDKDVTVSAVFMADTKYGDANCDGKVNLNDAIAILQCIALPTKYPLLIPALADIDGIPGLSGNDALVIQKVDAGLISEADLPLEN